MLPWFSFEIINIGFVKLHVWGIFVSLGFAAGMVVAYFEMGRRGLEKNRIFDLAFWIILVALLGGRLLYALEHWSIFFASPLDIVKLWHGGMSVYGGLIGGAIGGIGYLKYHKLNLWQYIDAIIFSLPLGLFLGRIGCFLIHDHPGIKTNFSLAVAYPDGARHDLGLYLSLNGLILFVIFLILRRKKFFDGFYAVFFMLWYGLARFLLDFLRASDISGADPRYFGLTLAQYLSLVLVFSGFYLLFTLRARREEGLV